MNDAKDVAWRSMLLNAGEVLARDAFNDNAEPETLISRTLSQLEMVKAELREREAKHETK